MRYSPEVGIDGSGRAIAVWLSARDGGSVQARVSEEAPLAMRPIAPGVSGLRLHPAAFRAARSGPATTPPRAGRGTRVSYRLMVVPTVAGLDGVTARARFRILQ